MRCSREPRLLPWISLSTLLSFPSRLPTPHFLPTISSPPSALFQRRERSRCIIAIISTSCVLSTDCSLSVVLNQHVIPPTLSVWSHRATRNTNMETFTVNSMCSVQLLKYYNYTGIYYTSILYVLLMTTVPLCQHSMSAFCKGRDCSDCPF